MFADSLSFEFPQESNLSLSNAQLIFYLGVMTLRDNEAAKEVGEQRPVLDGFVAEDPVFFLVPTHD